MPSEGSPPPVSADHPSTPLGPSALFSPPSTPLPSVEKLVYKKTPWRRRSSSHIKMIDSPLPDPAIIENNESTYCNSSEEHDSASSLGESSGQGTDRSFDDTAESSSDISFISMPMRLDDKSANQTQFLNIMDVDSAASEETSAPQTSVEEDSPGSPSDEGSDDNNTISFVASTDTNEIRTRFSLPAEDLNTSSGPEETPVERGRPSACLFVASLCMELSDNTLYESVKSHFSQWGDILFVKVLRDPSDRPYAFVQYKMDADARIALRRSQRNILDGRIIRCEAARVNRTLFISSKEQPIEKDELMKAVSKFGEVESVFPYRPKPGRVASINTGGWFAKYVYRDDAIQAYATLRSSCTWKIIWAQNIDALAPHIDQRSIFISHLNATTTKEDIMGRFGTYGSIVDCHVVYREADEDGQEVFEHRSFAFLTYEEEKAAATAIQHENYSIFQNSRIKVQYKDVHYSTMSKRSRYFFSGKGYKVELAPPPVHGFGPAPRYMNHNYRGNYMPAYNNDWSYFVPANERNGLADMPDMPTPESSMGARATYPTQREPRGMNPAWASQSSSRKPRSTSMDYRAPKENYGGGMGPVLYNQFEGYYPVPMGYPAPGMPYIALPGDGSVPYMPYYKNMRQTRGGPL